MFGRRKDENQGQGMPMFPMMPLGGGLPEPEPPKGGFGNVLGLLLLLAALVGMFGLFGRASEVSHEKNGDTVPGDVPGHLGDLANPND